jgi:hypothetical protein
MSNRNKDYYFGKEYITKDEAIKFCRDNNLSLLDPGEIKALVTKEDNYHIKITNKLVGRTYITHGNGNFFDCNLDTKAKLIAKRNK